MPQFSPSYYAVCVKMSKAPWMTPLPSKAVREAEKEERKAAHSVIKATPSCRKRYATKESATAALAKVKAPESVLKWLCVEEECLMYF